MKIETINKISELLSERRYWLASVGILCAADTTVHEIRFGQGIRTTQSRYDGIGASAISIGEVSPYFMVVELDDDMHLEIRRAVVAAVQARILSIQKQIRELGGDLDGVE